MKENTDKLGRHKATILFCPYQNEKVRIDQDIAPVISDMWKLGIHTTGCCQAQCNFNCKHKYKTVKITKGPDKGLSYSDIVETKHCYNNVWISFESMADVELLYNYVAEYNPSRSTKADSMYHCMCCDMFVAHPGDNCMRPKDHWSFVFLMRNFGVEGHFGRPKWNGKRSTVKMWVEDGCKKNNFVMCPQITFPQKHLPYVEEKLKLAIKNQK